MNRYVARGLLLDALEGKRIIVLSYSQPAARTALSECRRDPHASLAKVSARNGDERITFPSGGCIRFQSVRSSLRGMSADIVFIDDEADRQLGYLAYGELHDALRWVTHPHGEVIRA